jgi:hypothetical protein
VDLIRQAAEFLNLGDWEILLVYNFEREEDGDKVAGCLEDVDYLRSNASIMIADWFVARNSEEKVASLILHEILHIATIAPLKVFEKKEDLREAIGYVEWNSIHREMNIFNEQMNCRLERALLEPFLKSLPPKPTPDPDCIP